MRAAHVGLMKAGLLVAALLALLVAPHAVAQRAGADDGAAANIRPVLLAESVGPAPGQAVTIALLMRPAPGWHGYWENPGDAGLPMRVDWSLPAGVTVSPLNHPAPQRLVLSGLMNYVFESDYALLATLRVPADAAPGTRLPIRAAARWLACTDRICVPEQGDVALELVVGDGRIAPADRARFDGWRAALPRPLDRPGHFAADAGVVRIALPYPAAAPLADAYFYPLTRHAFAYGAPQTVTREGDRLIVTARRAEGAAMPRRLDGVLVPAPGVALRVSAVPGPVPRADASGIRTFLLALGGAILGGLLLNIMPCVFPILSLKALSLARAGETGHKARAEALAYAAGVMLTCLALGALMLVLRAGGAQIGWAFQLQDPRIIALLLLLMAAITLNLAGAFELRTVGAGQSLAGREGAAGAFWTGVLAAFVATPCSGPFMAAAIGAALLLPWPAALAVFAGLGLGIALPFLAIGFLPGLRRRLPRPGAWMERLRRILAVPMGITALGLGWLLGRQIGGAGWVLAGGLAGLLALLLLWIGQRQSAGRPIALASLGGALALGLAAIAAPGAIGGAASANAASGIAFSEAALARLRAERRPVFLYFTADWCLTCKVNEAAAIDRPDVRRAFAERGVAVMVGDWTNADPAITRFIEAQGRSGVPLYLYYAPGVASPQVLPQLLTPATLLALGR
jgi:thiol:disulfide interchange protein